jgi:replicative DNA helicase
MLPFNVKPPYDEVAERSILGAMLLDPENIPTVLEYVREEDFFLEEHRLLFSVIVKLWDEKGTAWDEVVLRDTIEKLGYAERLPFTWIEGLLQDAVGGPILEETCRTVKEKAGLRSLLEYSIDIVSKLKETPDFESLIEIAQSKLFEISERNTITHYYHIKEVSREVMEIIEKYRKSDRVVTGLASGFGELDIRTTGFHPADLIILAARPGMGKTSFMLSLIHHIASVEEKPVAVFSLEMSKEQLVMRMLSSIAEIPMQKIRGGYISDSEKEALNSAAYELSRLEIYIDDSPSITTTDLRIKARKLKKEKGISFVAIDYLQLLKPAVRKASRQEEVAEVSRSLKALAKELDIPVLALAQLSRQVEHRGDRRPQLADLRESGQIEQDADLIMFLHRPEYYKKNVPPEEQGVAELIIAKQRQGPTDTIKIAFVKEFAKFSPLAPKHYSEEEDFIEEALEESEESFSEEDYDLDF